MNIYYTITTHTFKMPWAAIIARELIIFAKKASFSPDTKVVYIDIHLILWGREFQMWTILFKKLRWKQFVRQSGGIIKNPE